jgi:hypothetical protein
MNYLITNNRDFFESIGDYNYCRLEDMVLPKTIAVDTETTSLKPRKGHMFALQIGTGVNNYLIDMQQLGGEITFKEVQPYLEGKDMVGHNLTFDLGWFYKYDGIKDLPEESHNPELLIILGSISAILLLCHTLIAKVQSVIRTTSLHVNVNPKYLAEIRMVFDRNKN